ncbi:MAG: hypothetical protein RR327_08915 [Clostridia bacterium]
MSDEPIDIKVRRGDDPMTRLLRDVKRCCKEGEDDESYERANEVSHAN